MEYDKAKKESFHACFVQSAALLGGWEKEVLDARFHPASRKLLLFSSSGYHKDAIIQSTYGSKGEVVWVIRYNPAMRKYYKEVNKSGGRIDTRNERIQCKH